MIFSNGVGKTKLTAHIQHHTEPDYDIFLLSFNDDNNKTVYQRELAIDWDMFGVGVLQAMQADDDPELEIVFRTNKVHPFDSERLANTKRITESVYFDIQQGQVELKDINKLSESAKELAATSLIHRVDYGLLLILFMAVPILTLIIFFLL